MSVHPNTTSVQTRGLTEVPTRIPAVVSDQIDLAEPGSGLVPLGERADGDLVLQQGSRLGPRPTLDSVAASVGAGRRSISLPTSEPEPVAAQTVISISP